MPARLPACQDGWCGGPGTCSLCCHWRGASCRVLLTGGNLWVGPRRCSTRSVPSSESAAETPTCAWKHWSRDLGWEQGRMEPWALSWGWWMWDHLSSLAVRLFRTPFQDLVHANRNEYRFPMLKISQFTLSLCLPFTLSTLKLFTSLFLLHLYIIYW